MKFIEYVNKVDELLELRRFDVLGESETTRSDYESVYRGIVSNVSKDSKDGTHIFGKVMNTLRLSGHSETRSSRRSRNSKLQDRASQPDAKMLNEGDAIEVRDSDSTVIRYKVASQEEAVIPNKEFYSYLDALKYVDQLLDMWED